MTEKKKKKHTALWVTGIVLLALLAADIGVGFYMVSFAIGRSSASGVAVAPKAQTSDEANAQISGGWARIKDETERWYAAARREEVAIQSQDVLRLAADFYPSDSGSHLYLLAVHGYTGRRSNMVSYAPMYAQRGFHVLTPDMRSHGDSEGNYIGMGWLDRKDMLLWIDWIVRRDPQARIVLHGVSMGGATVMMTAGESLPAQVAAAVEDCGYTSVWDEFADELKYLFHLPKFPVLHTASVIARFRAGYSFREASSLNQIRKTEIPVMFIHGSEDNFVRADMVYPLYEACPTKKAIYVAQGAGHGQAFFIDPEEYERQVFDFLGGILPLA